MALSKKVFVSIPYGTDETLCKARFEKNCLYVRELVVRGHIPISPLSVGHSAFRLAGMPIDTNSIPYAYWIKLSASYMQGVDELHVVMESGWDSSNGVGIEIEMAKAIGIPIYYVHPVSFLATLERPSS